MDEVDTKYALQMHIDPRENQNWHYSSKIKKVFTKMNSVMNVTLSYKPHDNANLHLRTMIVCTSPDDVHIQVKRCEPHKTQGLLKFYKFFMVVVMVNLSFQMCRLDTF